MTKLTPIILAMFLVDAVLLAAGSIDNSHWTFAQNVMFICAGLTLALFYGQRIHRAVDGPARYLMIGIVLNASGMVIHRAWFTSMRAAEKTDAGMAQWFLEHSWLLFVALGAVVVGTAYHLREWLQGLVGRAWLEWYLLAFLCVFNGGLVLYEVI